MKKSLFLPLLSVLFVACSSSSLPVLEEKRDNVILPAAVQLSCTTYIWASYYFYDNTGKKIYISCSSSNSYKGLKGVRLISGPPLTIYFIKSGTNEYRTCTIWEYFTCSNPFPTEYVWIGGKHPFDINKQTIFSPTKLKNGVCD